MLLERLRACIQHVEVTYRSRTPGSSQLHYHTASSSAKQAGQVSSRLISTAIAQAALPHLLIHRILWCGIIETALLTREYYQAARVVC